MLFKSVRMRLSKGIPSDTCDICGERNRSYIGAAIEGIFAYFADGQTVEGVGNDYVAGGGADVGDGIVAFIAAKRKFQAVGIKLFAANRTLAVDEIMPEFRKLVIAVEIAAKGAFM